jgi:hypothetical protein
MGTFPKSQPNFKQRFEKLVSQTNKLKGKNKIFLATECATAASPFVNNLIVS